MQYFSKNDMVRIGCNDCKGCFACCVNMGDSIRLNPYDIYKICDFLSCDFAALMEKNYIELQVDEGIILPNIKMQDKTLACGFLSAEGRCKIHPARPGLCRLFPLGRQYMGDHFEYFILEDACKHTGKTKVKIEKWLGESQITVYEKFVAKWFYLVKNWKEQVQTMDQRKAREFDMSILNLFFITPYQKDTSFYEQFEKRLEVFGSLQKGTD